MMLNYFSNIKNTKIKQVHYSPIVNVCMYVRRGISEYRSLRILL